MPTTTKTAATTKAAPKARATRTRTAKATTTVITAAPAPARAATSKGLEKGQLWQMKDTHVEIVEVGKRLAHYRLLPRLNQRGIPVKLGRREELEAFLKSHGAKLVKRP